MMNNVLIVALGGAIGASSRYWVGQWAQSTFGQSFPWGTFLANTLGGLLMGMLVGWLMVKESTLSTPGLGQNLRLFLGVGVLGGFTTFSAFSLETFEMIEKKLYGMAMGYVSASVFLSVFAVYIGVVFMRRILAL